VVFVSLPSLGCHGAGWVGIVASRYPSEKRRHVSDPLPSRAPRTYRKEIHCRIIASVPIHIGGDPIKLSGH